jgi:hypothetical protein
VNSEEKVKLLKKLPNPDQLKGFLPAMNRPRMLVEMLQGNSKKIADVTLIAMLVATARQLMAKHEDWDQYVSVEEVEGENEVPEPCGDPECEGCKQLEKVLAEAKEKGMSVKSLSLTKKQAIEMGLIDEDGNDLAGRQGKSCDDKTESSKGKIVH